MKTKALLALPLDHKSIEQAIFRVQHHLYCWLSLDVKEIDVIKMRKFGWSVERKSKSVTSVWFKRNFFHSLIIFFSKL